MGRKIPARKHRGVKDPILQLARRNACPTINAPPSKPNEQEVPRSILEIQRLCALVESREKERKGRKKQTSSQYAPIDSLYLYDKDPKLPGMKRKNRDVPRILQGTDEPDEAFVHRFTAAAQEFINEVELENKHDAKFEGLKSKYKENSESGPVSGEKSSKDESQPSQSKESMKRKLQEDIFSDFNLNNKRRRNRKDPIERVTKPNKRQRKKLRLAQIKKEEHYEDELESPEEEIDFTSFKDEVKFGEVVHRPPQFTAKPRGSEISSKPGTKDLLLKKMMNGPKTKEPKKSNTRILSNAQKHFLEKERIRVVQAYRDLKASKMKK